ncbi:exo-beta-N-acetylmuramidase NamZ domain-containing protein [Alicyclobacillus pomorum]|uniref:exo-beta-N-acetylmuramidase NamZ family protein n=1 Tax=Alicyclobacillus pomorum TaxID=204470 RepID=UPI00041049A3|nr:DUF1343 domain-containing protein [Alicyclobacillus pomorum]
MVLLGIEALLERQRRLLVGKRIGLVTNYNVMDRYFRSTVHLLTQERGWEVKKLFGPEHGVRNCAKEGEQVSSEVDPYTGLVAYSLYGDTHKPTSEMLQGMDVLVFDLVDVGARYYTNIGTMVHCLESCAELGLPLVVLDRPNPLNGLTREGNILSPSFASLVGMFPMPNRHGLTLGELAMLYNQQLPRPCDLTVVRAEGWQRQMMWPETGLPFVPPSPNTTCFDMVLLYPGTCLVEGTNLSEGRGTTRPFEIIGAPFADAHRVANVFSEYGLPGVIARPTYFVPTYKKYVGVLCQGVQLHVTDAAALQPVKTGLLLLETFAKLYPNEFSILEPRPNDRRFLDLLAGTDELGDLIFEGRATEYLEQSKAELEAFNDKVSPFYLY